MRTWLKIRRLTYGFSQKHLSELIGISPGYYSRIETLEVKPSDCVAKRIAELLGFHDSWNVFGYDQEYSCMCNEIDASTMIK